MEWAITTNLSRDGYKDFLVDPIPGCMAFNVSWHPSGSLDIEEFNRRAQSLKRAGYPVSVSVMETLADAKMDTTWFKSQGLNAHIDPFVDPDDNDFQDMAFTCRAGVDHIIIDPEGTVYPCCAILRSKWWAEGRMGNIFDSPVKLERPWDVCTFRCENYFVFDKQPHLHDVFALGVKPL